MNMTADQLLRQLHDAGVKIEPALDLDGPGDVLTDDTLAHVRQHKHELLRLLSHHYATCDADADRGLPVYAVGNAPLPTPSCPAEAESDLMILSFAVHVAARMMQDRGWELGADIAGAVASNLQGVQELIASAMERKQ